MRDLGLLIVRMTAGGLLAGHGAQKLFGWFGGPGHKGTTGMMRKLGLEPAEHWARMAGASELGGGVLTALGLFHPLGQLGIIGAMSMAWAKVHRGKPIWVTEGGAELPLVNLSIATALMLTGPGVFSLDRLFGIRVSKPLVITAMAATAMGISMGMNAEAPAEQAPETGGEGARESAGEEEQPGQDAAADERRRRPARAGAHRPERAAA